MQLRTQVVRADQFRVVPASAIMISHSPHEFRISVFCDLVEFDEQGRIKSVQRRHEIDLLLSPQHAKSLLEALRINIERYEKSMGEIKPVICQPPAPQAPSYIG